MNRLTVATPILAAALLSLPAFAHHSQSMFDTSKEILLEGTVSRLEWTNPHMYLVVATKGPDGQPALVEGEGVAITQALVDGLDREKLQPGTQIVARVNPNRGGWGKQVRVLDVTTQDGEIHPFYAANSRNRTLTPAKSLEGHWAPARQALGAAFGAMAGWPVSPAGRAAQAQLGGDGICSPEPTPFIMVLDELRTIKVDEKEVVLSFDNSGDRAVRTIHMGVEHPANVQPSLQGHSVGRWDGKTLVIDTIAFELNPSGLAMNVPSSAGKHTVERLTLADDGLRVRYEITVEDPTYLSAPAKLAQQWDHRPDLEFSQDTGACDPNVALKYKDGLPK